MGRTNRPGASERQRLLFLRNSKAITGLVILGTFTILGVIGPWIAPYDPQMMSRVAGDRLASPSLAHWLGTDHLARDIMSQLLVGTRGVMEVAFAAGLIATTLAVLIGISAAFAGGLVDEVLSMLSNIFLVIPALPLTIVVVAVMPTSIPTEAAVITVIAMTGWAWGARVMRAQALSLRKRDFVEAARASGESSWRIVVMEIMPNMTAIIASTLVGTVNFAILSEVTLAFIGIGSTSDWNWGTVLMWAQTNNAVASGAWWWFVPAGVLVASVGMALALINFGVDEFVNPRLRSTGLNAKLLRRRGIAPRVGFTPVVAGSLDEPDWQERSLGGRGITKPATGSQPKKGGAQ